MATVAAQITEIKEEIADGEWKDAGSAVRDPLKQVREQQSKGKIDRSFGDQIIAQLTALGEMIGR